MNLTIIVRCQVCNAELEAAVSVSYPACIRVQPCPVCLDSAKEDGIADGAAVARVAG